MRLICLPFAGGSASTYKGWTQLFSSAVEVCPIQPPGREARYNEAPIRSVTEMVPALATELAPLLDLPFAIYGHSLGAILAFELAHELKSRGLRQPEIIFAASHQAPQIPHGMPVSELGDRELIAHVDRMNPLVKLAENPQLLRLVLTVLRADLAMCDFYAYTPRPALDCAFTVFAGKDDGFSAQELDSWQELTTVPFQLRMLPGGHFFLVTAAKELLGIISSQLAQVVESLDQHRDAQAWAPLVLD